MSWIKWLKKLPIQRKLMLIMMATSSVAICLMAIFVMIHQVINSQRVIEQQLSTLASVLGERSTGALTFNDPETGTEILQGLRLKAHVVYAVIERESGEEFATFGDLSRFHPSYQVGISQQKKDNFSSVLYGLWMNEVYVGKDIFLENERIGKIYIISTLSSLYHDLLDYLFILVVISVVCFGLTLLICTRLQKVISEPILNLQKTMASVAENEDYSLRVECSDDQELQALIQCFNQMLKQIQLRDSKLREHRIHLEKLVTTRTAELVQANEKRIFWLESMACFLKHELKNSAVGVKTSLDLIERREAEHKNIEVYLARARKSLANMSALLQSIVEASYLEASLYHEEQQTLDLGELVNTHVDVYRSIYPDALIYIHCEQNIMVFGNEVRLIQLLDKLVSNAVEHSHALTPIKISVRLTFGKAQLLVANQGSVLPKDKQAMFDLFVSFKPEMKQTGENIGLGLYVVKLIAESHGGQVQAYHAKNPEVGAIFEVTFPFDSA